MSTGHQGLKSRIGPIAVRARPLLRRATDRLLYDQDQRIALSRAAFSVVVKDIPPYAIAAGVPAKPRRSRFSEEQIAALLRIAWWEWPLEQILDRVPQLCDGKIDEFIATYG